MAASLTLKQDDTYPPLQATLTENNEPLNLTTAVTVTLVMKGTQTSTVVTGECTVTNASSGQISYSWASGDTSTADTYQTEFLISWGTGSEQTVPNAASSNPTIEIDSRLDGGTG